MVKIRDFREGDLPEVLAVQAQCPSAAQWRAEEYQRLVHEPASLLLVAKIEAAQAGLPGSGENAKQELTGAAVPGTIAGFAAFHQVLDEAELRNLAVAPAWQRRGIGRLLLETGQRRMLRAGVKQVYLEVRASNNSALSLYRSVGYQTAATRKGYYQEPEEDAEILSLVLPTDPPPQP
jgi:[ribosomal protein S18]-alanine N-acetyltransferase